MAHQEKSKIYITSEKEMHEAALLFVKDRVQKMLEVRYTNSLSDWSNGAMAMHGHLLNYLKEAEAALQYERHCSKEMQKFLTDENKLLQTSIEGLNDKAEKKVFKARLEAIKKADELMDAQKGIATLTQQRDDAMQEIAGLKIDFHNAVEQIKREAAFHKKAKEEAAEYRKALELTNADPLNYAVQQMAEAVLLKYPSPGTQ